MIERAWHKVEEEWIPDGAGSSMPDISSYKSLSSVMISEAITAEARRDLEASVE